MLSAAEVGQARRRRRSPPSLKQQYHEYVLQRIEGYKNSIDREELLRLGDEAVSELQATSEGQFVLTEVLMLDSVDRLIMKRLAVRPYRRWREQFVKLRTAQRQPTHWGLDRSCPLVTLLDRLEPGDMALVVGPGAEPVSYLLAAHDVGVTYLAGDLGSVERVETRIASESLGSLFAAYVMQLGHWIPEFDPIDLVVVDAAALTELSGVERTAAIACLKERTRPGGIHVLLSGTTGLVPEALASLYDGWTPDPVARPARGRGRRGLVLTCPTCPPDTP